MLWEKNEDIFFQSQCNIPSFPQQWRISFPVLQTHNSIKGSSKPACPRERSITRLQHNTPPAHRPASTACRIKVPDEVHTDGTYPFTHKKAYPHTRRLTNSLREPSMHTQKCMWTHEKVCTQICLESQKKKVNSEKVIGGGGESSQFRELETWVERRMNESKILTGCCFLREQHTHSQQ